MPIYDNKRRVYVTPIQGMTLNYGFVTNIDQAQSAVLGHNEIGSALPPATVFGANAPKPARATKQFVGGSVSSFIDAGAITAARAAGWRVGRARLRSGGDSNFSLTVYVTLQGIKYAWNMPRRLYNRIQGDIGGLGVRVATNDDTDLVFGASYPKPPRAYQISGVGDDTDVLSTFVDPSVDLPEGWKAVGSGVDPLQAP